MKVEVKNLSKNFIQGESIIKALSPCTFTANSNDRIAITGTSGSGKSTLLNLLSGLEKSTEGTIFYDGENFTKLSKEKKDCFRLNNIGIVFQNFNLIPELTAYENIILPLMLSDKKPDETYIEHLITMLDLTDREYHLPSELSGGQRQRVAIARALVNHPRLLLCDEPTGNLDKNNTQNVTNILSEISDEFHITLIVVTHDGDVAKSFSRHITINDGVLGGDI